MRRTIEMTLAELMDKLRLLEDSCASTEVVALYSCYRGECDLQVLDVNLTDDKIQIVLEEM